MEHEYFTSLVFVLVPRMVLSQKNRWYLGKNQGQNLGYFDILHISWLVYVHICLGLFAKSKDGF